MTENPHAQKLDAIRRAGKNRDYERAVGLCTELLSETDQYPEVLLYLGRSYHALKRHDKAISTFHFFLSRKPDSPVGHFFLGRTYAAIGLYQQAIGPLKKVLERHPQFSPALSFLGVSFLKLKKPEDAIACFEKALKLEPRNRKIHNAYLNALLVQGIRLFYRNDLESAARIFEYLVKERRENILPYLYLAVISREFGDYPRAFQYYDEALKISPDDPVFHLHKAHLLLKTGMHREGLFELKQAKIILQDDLAGFSDPEKLLKLISLTHFQNKRYREAIYFGRQVLKNNYRDPDMHMLLAECYRFYGDLFKARNHFTRALESAPTRPEIAQGLAMVLWETGAYQELLALTRRMERYHPGDSMAAYFRVLCMGELGESPETLIPLLQAQIHAQGPDPHLMWSLAREYVRSDRHDLAEGWLNRTLKLIPGHHDALTLLDLVYEKLGRQDDEIRILKVLVDLHPDEIKTLKKYIHLLLAVKRYGEAAKGLEKLVRLEPSSISLKTTLGRVYIRNKNFNDALIIFKELITRDPKSVSALRQLIFCLVKLKNLKLSVLILEKAAGYIRNEPGILLPLGVLHGRLKEYEKASGIFRAVIGIKPRDWRAYHNLAMIYKRTGQKALSRQFLERAEEYKSAKSASVRKKKKTGPEKTGSGKTGRKR